MDTIKRKEMENYKDLHKVSVTVVYRYKGGATNKVKTQKQANLLNMNKGVSIGKTAKITYQITDNKTDLDFTDFLKYLHDEAVFQVGQFDEKKSDPELVKQIEMDFVKRLAINTPVAYDSHYVFRDMYESMKKGEFNI